MRLDSRTLLSAGFLALGLFAPLTLAAQQRYSCTGEKLRSDNDIRLTHTGDDDGRRIVETLLQRRGRCVNVALRGTVRLRDDLGGIAGMTPGSRALFHELTPASDRRLEVEGVGDALVHRYRVDGRERPFDADAERWYASLLLDLALRTGHGAATCVASLRSRGGTDAVLREIATLESDEGRRHYYRALLGATPALPPRDAERVLLRAIGDIRSDGDRRALLLDALRHGGHALAPVAIRAAAAIRSDGDKSALLREVARTHLHDGDASLRDGFFATARTIRSDGDLRRVLVAAVRSAPSEAVAGGVIASTGEIASDGDKTGVLVAVAANGLVARNSALRRAYDAAAATIRSSADRSRAERAVGP